jgi:hypothetical protein
MILYTPLFTPQIQVVKRSSAVPTPFSCSLTLEIVAAWQRRLKCCCQARTLLRHLSGAFSAKKDSAVRNTTNKKNQLEPPEKTKNILQHGSGGSGLDGFYNSL